ncbi:MAG: hypothetical protein CMH56_08200 [Myxococcales bacterium]|nr:hypothetical protein [Myxococcales bacterium]|tara:strand:+ start:5347 stop:6105 length:759 start_codon:yes stop_codon:yes gene_type:complete
MMARWRLYLGRSLIEEYNFDKDLIRIGRQTDADIVLDHQSVSRKHALLQRAGGIWTVKIEDGKNGLFVNGQFTTERPLKNGDRIEIGRHVILFIQTPNAISLEEDTPIGVSPLSEAASDAIDQAWGARPKSLDQKTVSMSLDELKRLHQRNQTLMEAHVSWFTDQEKQILPLQKQEAFIGKGDDCDIKISGGLPGVKRFACIYRKGEQYYLEPLSRFIPIKVKGQLLKEPARLFDGDKFQIFNQVLQFHEPM